MTLQQVNDSIATLVARQTALFALEAPTAEQIKEASDNNNALADLQKQLKTLEDFDAMRTKHAAQVATPSSVPVVQATPLQAPVYAAPTGHLVTKAGIPHDVAYRAGVLAQVLAGSADARTKANDLQMNVKTMVEGDNGLGGYIVPTEMSTYVIQLAEQYGVFAGSARIESMGSDMKTIARITQMMTAAWGTEASTMTPTDTAFDNVQLVAKKLYSYARYSSELEEDARINLGSTLLQQMAWGAAKKIDEAAFVGDGSASYGGIVGATTALKNLSGTIANIAGLQVGSGNTYDELTLADFAATKGRLPVYARTKNTAWYVSKDVFSATMERLALAAGGVTASEVINGVPLDKFLGYPVKLVEAMPKIAGNSQVCVLLADLTLGSTLGIRRNAVVSRDTSKGFDTDTVHVKTTWRVDVVNHEVGNASSTASARQAGAIVGLITAAS